jgi:hypothetical protein
MHRQQRLTLIFLAITAMMLSITATAKKGSKSTAEEKEIAGSVHPVLWSDPVDIRTRNLFYGPGGEKHAPHTTYTFEKEDMDGTSPKFIVKDENGVRWKVKMRYEARPETVASRLVWAVGYSTNEDYFMPELKVEGMPARLRRGQQFIDPAGTAHDVRLKRYLDDEKKVDLWKWSDNPFNSTKELNGLKVMMALINNWDLKDVNNSIYYRKHTEGVDGPENVYMVSDIGASFGTTGVSWKRGSADGILHYYAASKFLGKVTPESVSFATPSRPLLPDIFDPQDFFMRMHMRWIGRNIPRNDVRWIAQILAQLSAGQIRDAFRAAGYKPDEVEGFSKVVEGRIALLSKL